jgi:hypothetical protein
MPATTFSAMVPDISAYLQGCPNPAIERTLRKITTDLCQRAKVWREELTDIALLANTTEYTPASPVAYGEFVEVATARTTISGVRADLQYCSYEKARRLFPDWPMAQTGTPVRITVRTPGTVMIAPTPSASGTLNIYGILRPTSSASSWDTQMYREFHRELFHGVMHDLLMMPGRSWTDTVTAQYHGKQWAFLLNLARDRADRYYNSDTLSVQMLPAA